MREHAETILKATCGVLVALLLFQTVRALVRNDPFGRVIIPAVPTLAAETNAPATGGPGGPPMTAVAPAPPNSGANLARAGTNQPETNAAAKIRSTNLVAIAGGTNAATSIVATNSGTNVTAAAVVQTGGNSTNGDKLSPPQSVGKAATNLTVLTNSLLASNSPALAGTNEAGTNVLAAAPKKPHSHHPPMMGMGMPGMGMGGSLPELPPVVRSRIDQIVSSELLGPVMHPMPMGLLGIAGNVAFLRAGTGQTGLVKEGDTLGDVKLIRIGINRVLVEQNGQQQELMIFSGMGGESLLTTPDKNSNETTNH
jgi:hypothetical protein